VSDGAPVRPATLDDLPGLLAVYNEVIATSTAVFAHDPATLAERRSWFEARAAAGYRVLVAADSGGIAGFATRGDFRPSSGYRHTVEHSVHVRAGRRGTGVGQAVMRALFSLAAALDKHVMIGGVDAANEGSLRFHEKLGFERTGRLRQVGRQFDRWLDLVFVQRFIGPEGGLIPFPATAWRSGGRLGSGMNPVPNCDSPARALAHPRREHDVRAGRLVGLRDPAHIGPPRAASWSLHGRADGGRRYDTGSRS
jgi:L-amino acid N-acyltransferase